MAGEDAFRFGLNASDIVHELATVTVTREAFYRMDLEFDFDYLAAVTSVAEGELTAPFLDAATKSAFDLVADEYDGVVRVAG
jgi:hypothetical protein